MFSTGKSLFSFAKRQRRGPSAPRKRRRMLVESLETRKLLTSMPYGASDVDLGEFLLGSVAVTPVFLDSNGQLDPSTENWTTAHIAEVLGNIEEGLDWWVDALAEQSTIHELSFTVDTTYAATPVETIYEPINRRSNDYTLYVSEFLSSAGFNSGNIEVDVRDFNQSQRVKNDTNWSFTMFVVPSLNDSDGQFATGGSFSRAFAFAGGLFMIVPSTRPASTFTHEMGHIFWARDEYIGGGSFSQRRGYYNTQNLNAADNPTPGFEQQPSIMASGSLLDIAYANHTSPASTLAMVGWQDSDGDGIFDVMDVPHKLTGTGYFDAVNSTYRFSGQATVQTLANLNPSGLGNDITLNRIREIEYRFDGGDWQVHSLPDAYEVDLDLAIAVPSGVSQIEIRARDSKSTVESNVFVGRMSRADSTSVPGINGYLWIDGNKNGLRDLGENGQEFWTVTLVDNSGAQLDLRKTVEPDDYPDGQLTSGFNSDVTLNSVGTDADGRIGVFVDTLVSTGTKNFRGFAKSSQSYNASWNSETRRLQANFNVPTSTVSIDAIGSSSNSFGRIDAYNAMGELVGRYTTSELAFGQVETMTISLGTSEIAYIIAGGHAGMSVRLDNLQFGPQTTTISGPFGQYAFPSLPAGSYLVRATPNSGFIATNPSGGQQAASVTAGTATVDVDFGFRSSSSSWQNPNDSNDVNNDGFVTPLDVLLVVNDINQNGSRDLSGGSFTPPPFVDVSGDSFISPLDVLLVVNFLNQNGTGEGEAVPMTASNNYSPEITPTGETEQTHKDHKTVPQEPIFFGDDAHPTEPSSRACAAWLPEEHRLRAFQFVLEDEPLLNDLATAVKPTSV